ncbi:MAG: hypothetical protein OK452_04135 [Thaumarchaeota archaeon]|nr:hypothetical protein [Nitrososphaerota archaeon]
MSVGRKTALFSAAAALVSIAIIASSFLYLGLPNLTQSSYQGPQSVLAIQLTDPPHVPPQTTSLTLTYSSLSLLVGEPTGTPGQFNTKTVPLTPSGGSATLDLLKLQSVSQTIATASLPTGSVLYSVTFTETSMKIDIGGTVSDVTLASGGSSFTVTIAKPIALSGTSVALLQLNPVVVNTPTGYQLIPSAVGVVRASHTEGEDQVGSQQQLSNNDQNDLDHAKGSLASSILSLSASAVSPDVTILTVRISNTGNVPVSLSAIGLAGTFSIVGNPVCQDTEPELGIVHPMIVGDVSTTTTSTQTQTSTTGQHCDLPNPDEQVVFVPVIPAASSTITTTASSSTTTTTTTTTSQTCSSGTMSLANGIKEDSHGGGLNLGAGQCVELTFTGKLTFGPYTVVPQTGPGQTYTLNVIASNGANEQQSCTMSQGKDSCDSQHSDNK